MVKDEKILKWVLIGGVTLFGGYIAYMALQKQGIISVPTENQPDRTQTISTRGTSLNYRPRASYYLGNSGSVREVENHGRGEAVTPKTWRGTYGSILQPQVSGTFNGSESAGLYVNSQLLNPQSIHVTPQIESALAWSTQRRKWFGGGSIPVVEGTFG